MSVMIKGMEMPYCCQECDFCRWSNLHQTAACERHGYDPCFEDYSREHLSKRAHFCPLVEVKPHGRLIDAEKLLIDHGLKLTEEFAPTVIEAEGSE